MKCTAMAQLFSFCCSLLQVRMLADPTGAFTKVKLNTFDIQILFKVLWLCAQLTSLSPSSSQAVDLLLDNDQIVQVLGNKRSKR